MRRWGKCECDSLQSHQSFQPCPYLESCGRASKKREKKRTARNDNDKSIILTEGDGKGVSRQKDNWRRIEE